jgi:hypothetical protein
VPRKLNNDLTTEDKMSRTVTNKNALIQKIRTALDKTRQGIQTYADTTLASDALEQLEVLLNNDQK